MEIKDIPMYLQNLTREERDLIIKYRLSNKECKIELQKILKDKTKNK